MISGRKIAAISRDRLTGRDDHRRGRDSSSLPASSIFMRTARRRRPTAFQALDGVTTALELEVGTADIETWYGERKAGRLINYGVSIGHIQVRMAVLHDPGTFLPSGDGAHRAASPAEIKEIARRIEEG